MSKKLILLVFLGGIGLAGCTVESGPIFDPDQEIGTIDNDTFKQRVEARLQEFEIRMENLRNKVIDAREEVRASLRKDIDELHAKEVAARHRFAEMWKKGADKLEDEKAKMETALDDLRTGFEKAFSHAQ